MKDKKHIKLENHCLDNKCEDNADIRGHKPDTEVGNRKRDSEGVFAVGVEKIVKS